MAKKVLTTIKLQANAGQASPAPPVGPALGQHGINIMEFVKAFNAQTSGDMGVTIPVVITVFEDRSFTFITKTPPAAVLIHQAINIEKAAALPGVKAVMTGRDLVDFPWDKPAILGIQDCANRRYGDDSAAQTAAVLFHLIEHEIHHRAFILNKLAKLEAEPSA